MGHLLIVEVRIKRAVFRLAKAPNTAVYLR